MAENSVYYLSGFRRRRRSCSATPTRMLGKDFASIKGADVKGTLNGVPSVSGHSRATILAWWIWSLNNDGGSWKVTQSRWRPVTLRLKISGGGR